MMRSSSYVRTPPEAPEGLPVLVVRFALVSMARELRGRPDCRQWLRAAKIRPKIRLSEVEQGIIVAP
jgi:hypothetical protein